MTGAPSRVGRPFRIAALAIPLVVLAAACTSEPEAGSSTSTTVPPTTLPVRQTVPTVPSRTATTVDACSLMPSEQLERLLGDEAGPGEPDEMAGSAADGPGLVRARCAWPDLEDPVLTLDYLAPTTVTTGAEHLEGVLEIGTERSAGGRVVELQRGAELVGALTTPDDRVLETAVARRAALIYLTVDFDVSLGSPEFQALTDLTVLALRRAPR